MQGSRTTLFDHCQYEIFAKYGECSRWDGVVERLTVYADEARTQALEVRETFARRKDKLKERRSYVKEDSVMVSSTSKVQSVLRVGVHV